MNKKDKLREYIKELRSELNKKNVGLVCDDYDAYKKEVLKHIEMLERKLKCRRCEDESA